MLQELPQSNVNLLLLQQQSWPGSSGLPWYIGIMRTWSQVRPHSGPHKSEHRTEQGELDHLDRWKGFAMLATALLDKALLSRAHRVHDSIRRTNDPYVTVGSWMSSDSFLPAKFSSRDPESSPYTHCHLLEARKSDPKATLRWGPRQNLHLTSYLACLPASSGLPGTIPHLLGGTSPFISWVLLPDSSL